MSQQDYHGRLGVALEQTRKVFLDLEARADAAEREQEATAILVRSERARRVKAESEMAALRKAVEAVRDVVGVDVGDYAVKKNRAMAALYAAIEDPTP